MPEPELLQPNAAPRAIELTGPKRSVESDARLLLHVLAATPGHAFLAAVDDESLPDEFARDQAAFAAARSEAERRGWIDGAGKSSFRLTPKGTMATEWPPLNPTPFRDAFRKRKVRGPTHAAFDAKALASGIESSERPEEDLGFLLTVLWLSKRSKALREQPPLDHAALGSAGSTLLAIATANREHRNGLRKSHKAMRRETRSSPDGVRDTGMSPRFSTVPGQSVTLEDAVPATVDAVESWLFDAQGAPTGTGAVEDADATAARGLRRYIVQRGLHSLWQQALWEGWSLRIVDGRHFWTPDSPAFALLFDAWWQRLRANIGQSVYIAQTAWTLASKDRRRALGLARSVIGVERPRGRRRCLVVGRPDVKALPAYLLEREALGGSYLADFLARPLPKRPGLDCMLLLKAWHVLADLADILAAELKRDSFATASLVEGWALAVDVVDIVDAMRRCLDCPKDKAESLVAFLTWEKGAYKGLWGAPLVPVPGHGEVCLCRSVLRGDNPVRRTEIWLRNGGYTDDLAKDARGDVYEAGLRAKVRAAIAKNALLNDARCAENAIKKDGDFPEQIDLLVQVGEVLLVCEVKCFVFPADPQERFNHMGKVVDAAAQARRKAEALARRPDVAARALGVGPDRAARLRAVPLVVLNQGFGASYDAEGCIVTDEAFLLLYLGSGEYHTQAAVDLKTGASALGSATLYADQAEAERLLERTLADPPTLRRWIDRLKWDVLPLPTDTGEPLLSVRTILQEVGGQERREADELVARLGL